ncbi:MAG: HD domain-containing protein [Proteobacteria bacterium]|nr:HD domain-containing protein [Pseudomonadota bacterium]
MTLITILAIVAAALFGYAAWIIFFSSKISADHQRISVPLEQLAADIWLKHNEEHRSLPIKSKGVADLFASGNSSAGNKKKADLKTEPSETATAVAASETTGDSKVTSDTDVTDDTSTEPWSKTLKSFLDDCYYPYLKVIELQEGALPVIQTLLNIISQYGSAPSILAGQTNDNESIDLRSVKDCLDNVSLEEHTYSVTRNLISILKENNADYELSVPKALITGLAHDIGKIPEYVASGKYNTLNHSTTSADKLAELLTDVDVFWKKEAIATVKEHHESSKDQFTFYLKEADRRAREMEIVRYTSGYDIVPFKEWFSVDEFLERLLPDINIAKDQGKYNVFSFKGVVYAQHTYLYELARNLCSDKMVIDLMFVYKSEQEAATRLVVNLLKESGFIMDTLYQNRYFQSFIIKTAGHKKNEHLTPIKPDIRFDMEEIEKRKMGYLETIDDVAPESKK